MNQERQSVRKPKSSIEPLMYEIKPYFIAALGVYALLTPLAPSGSAVRVPFAFVLLLCSAVIFKWRVEHRFARR